MTNFAITKIKTTPTTTAREIPTLAVKKPPLGNRRSGAIVIASRSSLNRVIENLSNGSCFQIDHAAQHGYFLRMRDQLIDYATLLDDDGSRDPSTLDRTLHSIPEPNLLCDSDLRICMSRRPESFPTDWLQTIKLANLSNTANDLTHAFTFASTLESRIFCGYWGNLYTFLNRLARNGLPVTFGDRILPPPQNILTP